jgi:hypothetical protein
MASSSPQSPSTPSFPTATAYPLDFDFSPFNSGPTPEPTPLNQTPFERLYGRPEQYLDVTTDNARTSGTSFIPSSPPTTGGLRESNWTKQDEADFDEFIQRERPRFILDASTRMTYRHHLQNPSMAPRGEGSDRRADQNAKHTALNEYELQDGQVYRKAEWDDSTGKWEPPKYVLTYTDSFQLIADVHEALLHFGKIAFFEPLTLYPFSLCIITNTLLGQDKTLDKCKSLYYGPTKKLVGFILRRCIHCNLQAPQANSGYIKPIISHGPLDRLVIDLMDFSTIADREYKWILQMKDHFTKMVWLRPLRDKTALSVSIELEKWMVEHGEPRKL